MFYLNGDYLADADTLASQLETIAVSFPKEDKIRRIFIDEITTATDWETVLKRLVDNGCLRNPSFGFFCN